MLKSASKWGKYHTKYHTKSHDKTVLLRKGFLNPRTLFIDDIFINSFKDRAAWLPSADGFNVAIRNSIGMHLGCCVMPLRYNYDKPEKPRISRVFGYLARFFILFQTEKSSREVVIS